MTATVLPVFAGVVATLSLVAALFFLRFWRRTGDRFFFLFALAFAIDGTSRLVGAMIRVPDEFESYAYMPRLVTFALIVVAVALKNRK